MCYFENVRILAWNESNNLNNFNKNLSIDELNNYDKPVLVYEKSFDCFNQDYIYCGYKKMYPPFKAKVVEDSPCFSTIECSDYDSLYIKAGGEIVF